VREKLSCRACETISQPPAPLHPLSRGRAGPNLLAEVAFGKYGQHLPLHRQAERFAREGVLIEESTLCDWVGGVSIALRPILERIATHVRTGDRIHVDGTTVPILAKGEARTGRLWTVVRDDKPFDGNAALAAVYFYSPTRSGNHVATWLDGWTGIMQADAFAGYNQLYASDRKPTQILEAACWSHGPASSSN
jgi:transposase